eukprot:8969642-Pyramimonas_sp.AAC.1
MFRRTLRGTSENDSRSTSSDKSNAIKKPCSIPSRKRGGKKDGWCTVLGIQSGGKEHKKKAASGRESVLNIRSRQVENPP